MTGGDDTVVEISHSVFDKVGNVEQSITLQANHTDTDGLDASNDDDYIQSAVYSWYDDADRLTATANYGTNTSAWTYSALAARPGTPPASSDTVLVSTFGYNGQGRLRLVTDPKGIKTKSFYDDLGRQKYVVENAQDNGDETVDVGEFDPSDESDTGDANDKTIDRVTKYVYNGLSQLSEQTAMDPNADGTLSDNQTTAYAYADSYHADLLTSTTYPDSAGGSDKVTIAYNLDRTPATRTDQRGAVITFTYDATLHRPTLQGLTTAGTGTDTTIQSIKREYDTMGRLEKISSYASTDGSGTASNQVVNEFNDLQALARQYQEPDGAKDANTLYTQYDYDTTAVSSVYTKGFRLKSVTYPNARGVHYLYTDAGDSSGISDALSRVSAIGTSTTRGASDVNVIASYEYNGTSLIVRKDYPSPDVRLDLYGGTTGTYAGLDRFGRVKGQLWHDYGASADLFKINHGYDRASNRTYAQNTVYASNSHVYSYDNLHRLSQDKQGLINAGKTDTESYWTLGKQAWNLNALGNPLDTDERTANDWQVSTYNNANEISTRNARADSAKSAFCNDTFDTDSSANWSLMDGGDSFQVDYNNSNVLEITGVGGNNAAVVLIGSSLGPEQAMTNLTFPNGSPAGSQAGIVFGYKNANEYWLQVLDLTAQKQRVYHVVNGSKSQIEESNFTVSVGTVLYKNDVSGFRQEIPACEKIVE